MLISITVNFLLTRPVFNVYIVERKEKILKNLEPNYDRGEGRYREYGDIESMEI